MYVAMRIFTALHQVPHIKLAVRVIRLLTLLWLNKKHNSFMNLGNSFIFLTDVAHYTLLWAVESSHNLRTIVTYICSCMSHYVFSRYVLTKYFYKLINFYFSAACPAPSY